jgi:hypothetical protein
MYRKLGDEGASSLLAGLAVLMIPIPFILGGYGVALRQRSPWARVHIESAENDGKVETREGGVVKDES